jgi:hypothetical protein
MAHDDRQSEQLDKSSQSRAVFLPETFDRLP